MTYKTSKKPRKKPKNILIPANGNGDENVSLDLPRMGRGSRTYRVERIREALAKGIRDLDKIADYAGIAVSTIKTYAVEEGISLPGVVSNRSRYVSKPKYGKAVVVDKKKEEDIERFLGVIFDFGKFIVPKRGEMLVEEHPEILREYGNRGTLKNLAIKYLEEDYNLSPLTAKRAVAYALRHLMNGDKKLEQKLEKECERFGIQ